MKRLLLTTVTATATLAAGAAISGSALAADMAVKAPPAPAPAAAPAYSWTGFYVGGGFGTGFWDADKTLLFPAGNFVNTAATNGGGKGWLGQVIAGYDYQFAVANWNLVAGVFGDYEFGNVRGNLDSGLVNTFSTNPLAGTEKEKSAWSVGARLGWLVTPQILTYWDGGYTATRFDGVNIIPFGSAASPPLSINANTYHGWFTGAGVEVQSTWLQGLYWNTEYRFASYNSATLPMTGATAAFGFPVNLKIEPHVQTVMSGLRYKFGTAAAAAPAPVLYKARPAAAPAVNWTGLYAGAGFGYGLWDTDTSLVFPAGVFGNTSPTNNGGRGWLGQVVAGYDYQFAFVNHDWVAGVFTDYDFDNIKGNLDSQTNIVAVGNTLGGSEKEKSAWAVGGRLGILMWPQVLSYINVGYTETRFDGVNIISFAGPQPAPAMSIPGNTYHGWFTGAGVETQVNWLPGLFFNTEYRWAAYNSATLPIANAPPNLGAVTSMKLEPHVQTVMSGIRYKFNWPH